MSLSGTHLRGRRASLLLAAVTLAPALLAAQDTTSGALRLSVLSPTGTPAGAVPVALEEQGTGRVFNASTHPDGSLLLPALPPGSYRVHIVGAHGPQTTVAAAIQLGSTTDLTLTLLPSTADASVTVTASPLDEASPTSTDVFSSALFQQLPLNQRRWQSLAVLTPGLNPVPDAVSVNPDLLSANGLPSTQNSTRLDGMDDDQSFSSAARGSGQDSGPEAEDETEGQGNARDAEPGYNSGSGAGRHPGMAYTFSESAVREFRVTGQNDSAVTGHAAGAVITTVSRSGTPDLHGSLFYLNRSDLLAAHDAFSTVTHFHDGAITTLTAIKPHDLRQQFGATLGGPVRWLHHRSLSSRPERSGVEGPASPTASPDPAPPKLLFFYAFDMQRRGFPAVSTPQSSAFYALTPTQVALLGNRGVTRAQTTAALNYLDSLTGTTSRRQDQTIHFGKLDWLPTDRHRLSLQYNRARSTSPGGGRTGAVVNRGLASFGNVDTRIDSVISRWVYAPSARWSNEIRAQYGRDLHLERPQSPLPQEPAISPGGFAPEIAIGPEGLIFGTPSSAGAGPAPDERRLEFADVLTLSRGNHLLQLGADLSRVTDHIESLPNAAGTFHYDSGSTSGYAGGLVDWISDYTFNVNHTPNGACPSINSPIHYFCFRSFSQSFGAQTTRFSTEEWAAFLQDSWRIGPRFSLSAGVRYEYELLPLPQHPNADLDSVFGSTGATSIFPEDRNNVGPRLGLAWQPFGRRSSVSHGTILRLGYGLYFGRLPGATIRSALNSTALPSSTTRIRITPTVETSCPQVANQGFGYPCAFLAAPPNGVSSTTAALVFDRRFRLPVSQQGTVTVEQSFGRRLTASAAWHLSLTNQLPNTTDINIAPSTGTRSFILEVPTSLRGVPNGQTFSLPLYTARVDTAYGPVTDVLSNANSSYNALVLDTRLHASSGLNLHLSYTWSKSIDTGADPGAVPPTNGQLDPFNVRYDKAPSSLNTPGKLVFTSIWSPRPTFAPTPTHLERVIHAASTGWTVSPILVFSSGRPYTYNIFGGTRLSGGHESINGAGGSVYLPTLGRNTLRLPLQVHADLRVDRDLRTSERSRLRLSFEAFNLPNRTNITAVTQRAFLVGTPSAGFTPLVFQDAPTIAAEGLNTNPFGTPLFSAGRESQARQLQLGLSWQF